MNKIRAFAIACCGIVLTACSGRTAPAKAEPYPSPSAPHTVRYELNLDELKYVFGTLPPVAHVHAGDIIETNTIDSDGHAAEARGHKVLGFNALTGPFYIEEAEPGDTLSVKFLTLEVDAPQGYGDLDPSYGGAVNANPYTPMLGRGVAPANWIYPIDKSANVATFKAKDSNFSVKIPLHPFLGCVGVAPAGFENRSATVPAEFGGNMDAPESSVGNTLYLPVNVPGALLFMGDGHAAQGDGEIAGTAIEVSLRVRIQVDVIKKKTIHWPRFENSDYIMAVGSYRPLEDAARIAFTELIRWIHESYGLSEIDAYELLSKTAEVRLAEMVDPNYTVVAKINKKFLPARRDTVQ
jgi:amidase